MSFAKKIYLNFFLFILALSPVYGKVDHRLESQEPALEQAISLPNEGVLRQRDNGFVYLDVSNELISAVVPLLEHPGLLRARPTAARSMGAHISVFHEKEGVCPVELGEKFSFSVQDIRSFTLHTRDGLKKLWVISVSAPELEALRENYGCSPKLKGHDFHITLGKQVPVAPEGWREVEVLSPLNLEGEPAENLASEGDFVELENSELLTTATKVDAVGQLCIKGNGFTYLDVNNRFVDELVEGLPVEGAFAAISTNAKRMGAHISVIYEDEMIGKEIWTLSEAGQWFTFEVRALRYVDRKAAGGRERLWLLAAWAPGLERLRRSYGLRPKLQGHDFHITLGKEVLPSE